MILANAERASPFQDGIGLALCTVRGKGAPLLSINLRVLLADSDPERAAAVERSLSDLGNTLIVRVPPGWSTQDAVAAEAPDVVIVDMARPDRDGLDDLRRVTTVNP